VLVVDADALQAVDLLDLVDEPRGELLLALHAEDVVRVGRAVHERLARAHAVARLHLDVLALGDQVLARLLRHELDRRGERRDDDLALALGVLAEGDLAVDLADDGVILRLAGLEELGDAGQTAGDVLHLRGLARDLRDDVAGLDEIAFGARRCGADGEEVARVELAVRELERLAGRRILERDARAEVGRLDSMTTLRERPVTSSTRSCTVTPSTRSPNFTMPVASVRIGVANWSHSARSCPA
jgi:hypothetical protein